MDEMELPLEPRHLGVPSGISKTISEPTVCLAQNMHLSCTDTNNMSRWTKTRFHMTHVTLEFHRVRSKWFLRLWYIWHKPCNYLASGLAISLNGLNWASSWASSPWRSSGVSKNISDAVVSSAQTVHLSCVKISTIFERTESSFHLRLGT
jgi:hypothetical protein